MNAYKYLQLVYVFNYFFCIVDGFHSQPTLATSERLTRVTHMVIHTYAGGLCSVDTADCTPLIDASKDAADAYSSSLLLLVANMYIIRFFKITPNQVS